MEQRTNPTSGDAHKTDANAMEAHPPYIPAVLSPPLEGAIEELADSVPDRNQRVAVLAVAMLAVAMMARKEDMEQVGLGSEHLTELFTQTQVVDMPGIPERMHDRGAIVQNLSGNMKVLHMLPQLAQDPAVFEQALTNTQDINAESSLGTLGHILAIKGSQEQLAVALRHGLDPTVLSPSGARMEDLAQMSDRPEMVASLRQASQVWEAERGVGPTPAPAAFKDSLDVALAQAQSAGLTREEALGAALLEAAHEGKIERMDHLFDKGASSNGRIRTALFDGEASLDDPEAQTTPLHLAAATSSMPREGFEHLSKRSPNVNEMVGGVTPLMNAGGMGSGQNVAILAAAGADLNVRNSDGLTAKSLARMSGNSEASEALEQAGRDVLRVRAQELNAEIAAKAPAPRTVSKDRGDSR